MRLNRPMRSTIHAVCCGTKRTTVLAGSLGFWKYEGGGPAKLAGRRVRVDEVKRRACRESSGALKAALVRDEATMLGCCVRRSRTMRVTPRRASYWSMWVVGMFCRLGIFFFPKERSAERCQRVETMSFHETGRKCTPDPNFSREKRKKEGPAFTRQQSQLPPRLLLSSDFKRQSLPRPRACSGTKIQPPRIP